MLFQPLNQDNNSLQTFLASGTITKPTEKQLHSWRSVEVQNLTKKISRHGHTSTLIGDNMIIIGGTAAEGLTKEEFACFNLNLKTQVCEKIQVKGRDSKPLMHHSACYWKDNKIIVYGGPGNETSLSADIGILTLAEGQGDKKQTALWEFKKTNTPMTAKVPHKAYHTAHIYKDKMYVIGGMNPQDLPVKDLWYLDLNTWEWVQPEEHGKIPKDALSFHSSFLHENKIYVFNSTFKNIAWDIFKVLNLDTLTWESLNSEGFPKLIRNAKCSQPVDKHVYVLGADEDSSPPVRLWNYDIPQNRWTEIKQEGKSLTIRKEFTLTEYRDQLYVFGGWNSNAKRKVEHDNYIVKSYACHGLWAFSLSEGNSNEASKDQEQIKAGEPVNLAQIMKKLVKEAPYHDITFEVESKEIPAHKWFLIKNSKYFANMFSSGMIESKTSKIPISDMKAKTFESFLEFLYSNDVKLDKDLALELLEVADKYSVPDLRVECEDFLSKNVDMNNYVVVARLADLVDSVTLRKAVVEYMAKWIRQLKSRPDFDEISDDYVREIIIKLTVR